MTTFTTISTLQLNLQSRKLVSDITARVADATQEISTGYRKNVYDDLGARAAQTLDFRNRMDRTEDFVTLNAVLAGKLEMMEDALTGVRDSVQEFLNVAVGSATSPNQLARELQNQAKATLNFVMAGLNAAYGGEYLFAGVATDVKPLQDVWTVNPATGNAPMDVVTGITGAGPVSAADAAGRIAALDAVFASAAADPLTDFEATFYNGTDALTAGVPNPRATAQIDDETRMDYGMQANDPAMRDVLKGLMMFAATDVTQIADPAAYAAWAGAAVEAIASGLQGLDEARVAVGSDRKLIETTMARQSARMDIYNMRIVTLETADPYETAARLQAFQVQLEATYAATARVGRMSFLSYL